MADVAWVTNRNPTPTPEESAYLNQAWEKGRARQQSVEAKTFAAQYFATEARILDAFRFVSPASGNGQTYSTEFGSIIKEASNLFELVAKAVYARLYNDKDKINIYNYLALEAELDFARAQFRSIVLHDTFAQSPEVLAPFVRLRAWTRNAPVDDSHTPLWWKAYNSLKHSNEGLTTDGTLANAIAALAGACALIHRVYGPGLIFGQIRMEGFGFIDAPGSRVFITRSLRGWYD